MSNARLYSHPRKGMRARGHDGYGMRSAACHYLHMYETGTIIFSHEGRMSVHMRICVLCYTVHCTAQTAADQKLPPLI
jgi:hypothetical protein